MNSVNEEQNFSNVATSKSASDGVSVSGLSGRELDAAVAERVMGWVWWATTLRFSAERRRALFQPELKNPDYQLADGSEEPFTGDNYFISHYSSSIAAAFEMQSRISDLGLAQEFAVALGQILLRGNTQPITAFDYANATAEQRCRAALQAVEKDHESS